MILPSTRRQFLKNVTAPAAALMPLALHAQADAMPPQASGQAKRVVVIGAGLSGLVAAFELVEAGHEVIILEARMRPGGRVYTLRDPFADGLYAEAGAMEFGDGFTQLMGYVKRFDLPVTEVSVEARTYFIRGQRYVVAPGQEPAWSLRLTEAERKLGRAGLAERYVSLPAGRARPLDSGRIQASALEYDSMTLDGLFRRRGLSAAAVSLLHLNLDSDDFDHVSALQSLAVESYYGESKRWLALRAGNDRLPHAFAQRLGQRIRYGAAVVSVGQDHAKVRISIVQGGSRHQVEADRAVLAIPFSVLRGVQLDSSISAGKHLAISKLQYESLLRVYLQFRERFWLRNVPNGIAYTDSGIGMVLDHTSAQPGQRGILEAQLEARKATSASLLKGEERIRWAAAEMERVHPGAGEHIEGGVSFAWDDDPWSLGAWAYYAPGQIRAHFPHVATPEGRIHFAGEHTSSLPGTLEGAVASAVRAAREIARVA